MASRKRMLRDDASFVRDVLNANMAKVDLDSFLHPRRHLRRHPLRHPRRHLLRRHPL